MIYQSFSRQEMDFVIKDATIDDIAIITKLYNQGNKTANGDLEPVSIENRMAWFHSHGDNRPIIGVYHEDKMVAWASLSNMYDRPAYYISTEVSIYIDEPYKSQGLGSAMLEILLKLAKNLNIKNITALIFGDNAASLALFGKFNFENWGYLPKVCLVDDMYKDILILGKAIE